MSSFTALMALSASKTQEQNNMAQRALLERQKKEQELRKQQADREARERELEKKLRMKHFEDEKREQERRKRMEATQKAREAALQGKRDEQRDALLYGPKKAASGKASSSSSSSGGGGGSGGTAPRERRRLPDDDADDSPSGSMLTREELRERKQQAENKRLYSSAKRPSTAHSYFKSGRKLPGGAVDIPTTQQTPGALAGKSVKDRIAAMPNSLTKLNMVKRDTRTIDEIHTELQRKKEGKVLGGDEAKSFDGWFSSTKKKDPVNKKVQQPDSTTGSGANTPTSSLPAPSPSKKPSAPSSLSTGAVKSSAMKATIPKSSSQPIPSFKSNNNRSRAGSLDKYGPSKATSQPTKFTKHTAADRDRERDRHAARPATSASGPMKKRPRSESRSESPPPKRRATSMEEEDLPGDLSSTIWSIFGRKRDRYVGMDVFSDDEDMEVDARVLEREEKFSARVAKKEDLEAIEEERRHEEEKRKRKKEKERGQR